MQATVAYSDSERELMGHRLEESTRKATRELERVVGTCWHALSVGTRPGVANYTIGRAETRSEYATRAREKSASSQQQ